MPTSRQIDSDSILVFAYFYQFFFSLIYKLMKKKLIRSLTRIKLKILESMNITL